MAWLASSISRDDIRRFVRPLMLALTLNVLGMAASPAAAQRPASRATSPTTGPTTRAATQPARPGLGAEFTSLADFRNYARAEGKRVEFPAENGILLLDVAANGSAGTVGLQAGDIIT